MSQSVTATPQPRTLRQAIRAALDELGVPGPGYPAPVASAVGILEAALKAEAAAGTLDPDRLSAEPALRLADALLSLFDAEREAERRRIEVGVINAPTGWRPSEKLPDVLERAAVLAIVRDEASE